ncbi:MAG: glycosyltransferase family 2 protein [Promethearchaeota archaeon]
MKISLMIPVWKRFEHINSILKSWIPQVDEILVWDNSGKFKTSLPITVINSQKNLGSHVKFKSAQLLKHDMILVSDDDIIPKKELVQDLIYGLENADSARTTTEQERIITIYGRQFTSKDYSSAKSFWSHSITKIIEVDWGGRLLFGHRSNFTIDISDCYDMRLDDLFWSFELRKQRPRTKIFIVPTKQWSDSSDASDKHSIFLTKGYWKLRNDFFRKYYRKP